VWSRTWVGSVGFWMPFFGLLLGACNTATLGHRPAHSSPASNCERGEGFKPPYIYIHIYIYSLGEDLGGGGGCAGVQGDGVAHAVGPVAPPVLLDRACAQPRGADLLP